MDSGALLLAALSGCVRTGPHGDRPFCIRIQKSQEPWGVLVLDRLRLVGNRLGQSGQFCLKACAFSAFLVDLCGRLTGTPCQSLQGGPSSNEAAARGAAPAVLSVHGSAASPSVKLAAGGVLQVL